jgi:hypothetical protein
LQISFLDDLNWPTIPVHRRIASRLCGPIILILLCQRNVSSTSATMSKRKVIAYALCCYPTSEGVPQHADASWFCRVAPGGGRSWSDLPWQGTGGEQCPRAPRHDPAGVALSDVPQAKRAGAAVPKADEARPRNHLQDMIIALMRGLLVAPWQLAPTGRLRRVSSCVRSGGPTVEPDLASAALR